MSLCVCLLLHVQVQFRLPVLESDQGLGGYGIETLAETMSDVQVLAISQLMQRLMLQDKLKEACNRAVDRATASGSPEQGKLATRLRAELEVHKEALATAKEEVATLASSLENANSWIEVCSLLAHSPITTVFAGMPAGKDIVQSR